MAEQLIAKNLEYIKVLPYWAQDLAYKYLSKTANLYVLHGNIRDFLPNQMKDGDFLFVRVQEFISEVLFGNKDIIAFYDRSSGINFCTPDMQKDYISDMIKLFPDAEKDDFISAEQKKALSYVKRYFQLKMNLGLRMVLIIDFAETIIPNAAISNITTEDRYSLVTMNRWAHDPVFTLGDISVILLTENITDLNKRISGSPSTIKVNIPFPDQRVREQFIEFVERKGELILSRGLNPQKVAAITSGLNLTNLNQLIAESYEEDRPIDLVYLRQKKKEIIENEAGGLLEFIESEYDLDFVSGHDFVVNRLRSATRAIKKGNLDVLPMGYLVSGPVGTGKSFLAYTFAGEVGIPIVKLKHIQQNWEGLSESNLEKILSILKAMAPVGVLIDEADIFLGTRDQEDHTGRLILSQITSFMGNTAYRGRIIWFLITSRPDRIPMDLKRQGRAEEHLALFYPDTPEEKDHLYRTLIKKLKLKVQDFSMVDLLKRYKLDVSGADIESILIRSKFNAAMNNHVIITREDVEETLNDFVPPSYPHEIDLQNLVAILECTSREMIPKKFQNLDRNRILNDIRLLKEMLGER